MDVYSDLISAGLEKLASHPSNTFQSRIYYNTTEKVAYIHDGSDWKPVGSGGIGKWTPSTDYKAEQVVWELSTNKIYRANADFTSGVSFVPANWTILSSVGTSAETSYSNATSGLTATNAQDAIDEIEARLEAEENKPTGPVVVSKKLSSDLAVDGVVDDLDFTGELTVAQKYLVTASVRAVRSGVAQNEIQTLEFSAVPNEGKFAIDFDGQVTVDLWYDTTASEVQQALRDLSNLDAAGVNVVGDFASGFDIEFVGAEGNTDHPQITLDSNTLKSGGTGGVNEIQTFTFSGTPTSGTFTLELDGQVTAPIAYDATAADVKAALELLPNIDEVTVTDI